MIAIPHYISPEEYLSIERRSPIRHEYRCGLVYAMAGGSDSHERIAFNLLKLIDNHLEMMPIVASMLARSRSTTRQIFTIIQMRLLLVILVIERIVTSSAIPN